MHLWAFLGVAAVIVVTPGVDMALVTKNALAYGRNAAVGTAFGVNAGIALWTIAASAGLATVVAASAPAFTAIKLAGALYLVYLGLRALRGARRREAPGGRSAVGGGAAFRQGLLSNLLNPKIAVFFTSLLPQFVDPGSARFASFLVLGAIFNALGILWLVLYAVIAARARRVMQRPKVKARLDVLSGTVLVALGVRLALERRP
jgi:threonine/homoserine/homoserine lactone efflux protein